MLEFQLFRIKVYPPKQRDFLRKDTSRSEILKDTIISLPSGELRKEVIWHIGNVKGVDDNGLYFRIGKTLPSKIELYKDGNFIEQKFETAPYTHVILDVVLEVCAIAKKTKLSPKPSGIASQFIRLLNKSEEAKKFNATFEIDAISDPEDFISYLQEAYVISKFWVTFSKPNAFDVNEDFIRPMQKLLKESDGEKGKSEVKGESLNIESLSELARSAATTGDDASAEMRLEPQSKKIRKYLKSKLVNIQCTEFEDVEQKKGFLTRIRNLYQKIRGKEEKKINEK